MNKKIIYHGSSQIVNKPIYGTGKSYNDYGQGFYCTEHIELAKEWACSELKDGYANKYEIDLDGLNILNLTSKKYNVLNWLAILLNNRQIKLSTPLAKQAKEYLLENFLIDYEKYDIIIGYRVDDSYFSFARAFISNEISLYQLSRAMKLGKPGEQIVLISKKAFDSISFIDYSIADSSIYYSKRKYRDEKARKYFIEELEKEDLNGIFIRDIIRENIKNDDKRIR